jgi:hypothetical protein
MSGTSDLFRRTIPEPRWSAILPIKPKRQWKPKRWLPIDDNAQEALSKIRQMVNR